MHSLVPAPPAPNSDLLMISLPSVLSGSRHLAWPRAALHAVTHSRRDCLTAVWITQAWGLRNVHTLERGLGPRSEGKRSGASLLSSQISSIFRAHLNVSNEGGRSFRFPLLRTTIWLRTARTCRSGISCHVRNLWEAGANLKRCWVFTKAVNHAAEIKAYVLENVTVLKSTQLSCTALKKKKKWI